MSCVEFQDVAAELALDQVPEPGRSTLLSHAHRCATCASLLDDLASVSDQLLLVAPEAEPPLGFEDSAVIRMQLPSVRTSRRWFAVLVSAAAVVTLVVGGFLLSGGAGEDGIRRAAVVDGDRNPIGTVELATVGHDARLILALEGPHDWPGEWACELRVDGRWVEVGTWTADDVNRDVWATGIDRDHSDATAMRILGRRGGVVATADLR